MLMHSTKMMLARTHMWYIALSYIPSQSSRQAQQDVYEAVSNICLLRCRAGTPEQQTYIRMRHKIILCCAGHTAEFLVNAFSEARNILPKCDRRACALVLHARAPRM